ncbi:MAG: hypothetical protein KGK34_09395 [Chloroflexota bacterium]|nr:hypothetical protein [Chloroflexota bacterium]
MVIVIGVFSGALTSARWQHAWRPIVHWTALAVGAIAVTVALTWSDSLRDRLVFVGLSSLFILWESVLPAFVTLRWRSRRLTHEHAAILFTLLGPSGLAIIVVLLPHVDDQTRSQLVLAAAAGLLLGYPFARLVLRWLGGEYDPPSSGAFRRPP